MPSAVIPRPQLGLRHPILKSIRKAHAKGGLTEEGWCIAEGFHLLEEALQSGRPIRWVIAAQGVQSTVERRIAGLAETRFAALDDATFASLAGTDQPQGVLSLVEPPAWTLDNVFRGSALAVILDGLQEPGNAGAIIRTAEAFGATGVVALKNTVNLYNPKVVRASAGSLFRLPVVQAADPELVLATLRQRQIQPFAALPREGVAVDQAALGGKCALVIGSEAHGVSPAMRAACEAVSIPTVGVESLNAAIAAAILLYEARRRRGGPA